MAYDSQAVEGLCRVRLSDGRSIEGLIEASNPEGARIRLPSGRRLLVQSRRIRGFLGAGCSDRPATSSFLSSPHRERYLVLPSGIGRRGATISTKELLLATQAEFGFSDRFSLLAAGSLPAMMFGVANGGLGGKLSFEPRPSIHWGIGWEGFALQEQIQSAAFSMVTLDRKVGHVSLGLLVPLESGGESVDGWQARSTMATFSGCLQIGRRLGLVTENWMRLAPDAESDQPRWVFSGVATRFGGRTGSFDLGIVILNEEYPVPWIEWAVGW